MGLLDFLKDSGKDLFGSRQGSEAQEIKREVEKQLGNNVSNLGVLFQNGRVTLQGEAKSDEAKEKAVLIAGNVRGVESVNDDGLRVAGQAAPVAGGAGAKAAVPGAKAAAASKYYTIEKGDTLSEIAQKFYGDASKYQQLFEANREVIGDPDKIYPGQRIRVPQV